MINAVNRTHANKDPIDEIITDRITNLGPIDTMLLKQTSDFDGRSRTGVNMNDFIESIHTMNRRATNHFARKAGDQSSLRDPLLSNELRGDGH